MDTSIRAVKADDYNKIRYIHQKYYEKEFSFADFIDKHLNAFVVTDSNDNIICASGVRTILEAVTITNKDFSVRARREALIKVLEASMYMSSKSGYNQLHAFIQDDHWLDHLKDAGFQECRGKALYINL